MLLQRPTRQFSLQPPLHYEGVNKDLRSMKHQKPWLQALRERDEALAAATAASTSIAPAQTPGGPAVVEIKPKRMKESYFEIILPLSKDEWLVDTYVNASGQLRMGTLFQDLDALAGVISYKHTGPGPTVVTAAVDRISIISPLSHFCDLRLSGFVSYVGKSSMEVSIEVRKMGELRQREKPLLLTCAFTMVALDPVSKKATPISPLIVEIEEEKRIFARGEAYKKTKATLASTALTKSTPNDAESDLIHSLWLRNTLYNPHTNPPPSSLIYMSPTTIHSTSIMQPQYRNRHSFMVFGGYLMKNTFELAFCCASASTRSRPTFVSLDPSTFLAPVPVGAVLYLSAAVAYAEPAGRERGGTRIQIRVESRVRDVEGGAETETGVFNYTFWIEKEGVEVMPVTYEEFMNYIDARRRAEQQRLVMEGMDDGTMERVTE
ncbi:Thioesterase/thiol ester dehydrase-isomerase [Terfezia boudieri ATCC MYA-4762]|uniref:Thioesterase/thiol ester dehydrase-isomerase n=1 Tax=Terfezia boudieri ATCC MYA-4762 TaxID=1051890 RepID=A0A3N4M0A7_9PEZI|nr:Thioesterase/thiol ester dehydrase-isomerase [Terfezia boudieri ATCC MYA-4762]